jgi:multidrug efflux pump subunit AcrA (membrane-fusion protein)
VAESQIETLSYRIEQKSVTAPFDGFVAAEHTQVGQWIQPGGPVVTLVDISRSGWSWTSPNAMRFNCCPMHAVQVSVTSLAEERGKAKSTLSCPRGTP